MCWKRSPANEALAKGQMTEQLDKANEIAALAATGAATATDANPIVMFITLACGGIRGR